MYYNFNQYINLGANLEKDGCNFAIYVKNIFFTLSATSP